MTTAQEQDVTAPPDDLVARLTKARDETSTTGRARAGRLFDDAADRIATLTAENKALRQALRRNALSTIGRPAGTMNLCTTCKECGGEWVYNTPERHSPGCLAAGAANER